MKNSIKSPISVFIELLEVLVSITLSTFIPVLDVLLNVIESIIKVFNNDSKILFKTALFIKNKAKELAKISFLIYYLILLFSEFGLLLNILQGYIEYTKFEILFLYTFFIITASVILINLMRKKEARK